MSEKKRELRFEEALARLEQIVAEMEAGDLSLEDSMKKFEEGMRLTRLCAARLGEAEKRIEVLLRKADGGIEWKPLEAEAGADEAEADAGAADEDDDGATSR